MDKLGHILAAAGLATMAWLQVNDPDPIYWVAVYLIAMLVPLLHLIRRRPRRLYWLATGMIAAGLLISLVGFIEFVRYDNLSALTASMQSHPRVEAAREFLGLLIALAVMLIYYRKGGV